MAPASGIICQNTKAGRLGTFWKIKEEMDSKVTIINVHKNVSA